MFMHGVVRQIFPIFAQAHLFMMESHDRSTTNYQMKKQDILFGLSLIALFAPFAAIPSVYDWYTGFNREHGMWMSFIKFAILATAGESIGLRIRTGKYNQRGFGLLPRAVVWGFLGLTIKLAFVVFTYGSIEFIKYLGLSHAGEWMAGGISPGKVLVAFCISLFMNTIYAPVMMTLHKITDNHILLHQGRLAALMAPVKFGDRFAEINWQVQWGFVFKKTIPFFWVPAHTLTFLLPVDFQVLFAALLGIALGIILALASLKGR